MLFLDELVLWLAFAVHEPRVLPPRVAEADQAGRVGSSAAARSRWSPSSPGRWTCAGGSPTPAPAVSEQEALDRAFRHQEGRFATIELGDDNLPYVASKRLLQAQGRRRQAVLDDAFRRLDRSPKVWDVLLDGVNTDDQHRGADEKAFRLTYPSRPPWSPPCAPWPASCSATAPR